MLRAASTNPCVCRIGSADVETSIGPPGAAPLVGPSLPVLDTFEDRQQVPKPHPEHPAARHPSKSDARPRTQDIALMLPPPPRTRPAPIGAVRPESEGEGKELRCQSRSLLPQLSVSQSPGIVTSGTISSRRP